MDNASDDCSEEGVAPNGTFSTPARSLRHTLSAEKEKGGSGSASHGRFLANQRPPRSIILPNDGRGKKS